MCINGEIMNNNEQSTLNEQLTLDEQSTLSEEQKNKFSFAYVMLSLSFVAIMLLSNFINYLALLVAGLVCLFAVSCSVFLNQTSDQNTKINTCGFSVDKKHTTMLYTQRQSVF